MKLIELTRVCNVCGKRKSFKEFHKRKDNCFGIRCRCKICRIVESKAYTKHSVEKRKARYKNNIEIFRKNCRAYYKTNSEKIKAYHKACRKADPVKTKEISRKENAKQKLKPNYKLNNIMRSSMSKSLKNGKGKNGKHWESLVPYTIDGLIKRLKKTIPKGYTWKDYINGKTDLSIDHIIPIFVHNFKSYTDIDFQRCWALKNLQLLPLVKNISKGAKLEKPFQPSLSL